LQQGPSAGREQEKEGRIQSGLGDWRDGRGVRRRGEGGSVRRSQEEERPPPGYEEVVGGR